MFRIFAAMENSEPTPKVKIWTPAESLDVCEGLRWFAHPSSVTVGPFQVFRTDYRNVLVLSRKVEEHLRMMAHSMIYGAGYSSPPRGPEAGMVGWRCSGFVERFGRLPGPGDFCQILYDTDIFARVYARSQPMDYGGMVLTKCRFEFDSSKGVP